MRHDQRFSLLGFGKYVSLMPKGWGMRLLQREEIYDCLDDDAAFARLPGLIADSIDARSAVFHWRNPDLSAEVLAASNYWSPEDMGHYVAHFADHDLWAQSTLTPETSNKLWVLEDLVSPRTYQNSTFYNEWIRSIGDDTFHCVGMSISSPSGLGLIGIHRGRGQGAFDETHLENLQIQLPHVRRLMRVRGMLAEARHERGRLEGALDSIALAMFTVTREQRVVHANLAAEKLLASEGPFRLHQGRIGSRDASKSRALGLAIAAAACPRSPSASFIEVPDQLGRKIIVTVTPLAGSSGRNVLLLCQPFRTDVSVVDGLKALFDLTAAEGQVAVLLSEGMSLVEIAGKRGVSIATVRTQFKAITAKMRCQRQAEVVALVKGISALQSQA